METSIVGEYSRVSVLVVPSEKFLLRKSGWRGYTMILIGKDRFLVKNYVLIRKVFEQSDRS